jgi:hypothetical protein
VKVVTMHQGSPYWASLLVNGEPSGTTPALLRLPAGEHDIVIQRSGFRSETRRVKVAPGAPAALRIELRR